MRSPAGKDPSVCPLVLGRRRCTCAEDAPRLDDQQIVARASGMLVWYQRAEGVGRAEARRGLETLLSRTRHRTTLLPELLRIAITVQLLPDDPTDGHSDAHHVDLMLAEFGELADRAGDTIRRGEAAVFRALRSMRYGFGDSALPDAAVALATLTDVDATAPATTGGESVADWSRRFARSLNGLVMVLLRLGAHELADDVSRRAIAVSDQYGTPMERLVNQLNRVRLQVSWALRLERGGRAAAAATRFVGAAQTARTAATLWGPAHTVIGAAGHEAHHRPVAIEECSIIGAALALHHPSPAHLDMLTALHDKAHFLDDRIVLAIATSRCLRSATRADDALGLLLALYRDLHDPASDITHESVLTLALHRELATLDAVVRGEPGTDTHNPDAASGIPTAAARRYAAALETELWALREARLTALRSHTEHRRIVREHGDQLNAATAQALQDPLTGLPNRRALDLRLTEATTSPAAHPCTVALIDLDGFKAVNDAHSHAAGDAVLREIAACLRTTLRGQDMVARYGGDEFVVVMPCTPLPIAISALSRATEAVAALPTEAAAGVTMSVGVAGAPLGGDPGIALAAADAAMYRAKHAGGNTVVGGGLPGTSRGGGAAAGITPSARWPRHMRAPAPADHELC